jgi:hypothetical protein
VLKYFFINEEYIGKGFGRHTLGAIIAHLVVNYGADRLNVKWVPFLKNKRADPSSKATSFFMKKFGMVHGREVPGVSDYLTLNLKPTK